MTDDLSVETAGPVARVTFTRPDLGNAVTPAQARALSAALEGLDRDPAVRVVVLTGSGSTFNVGAARAATHASPPAPGDAETYRDRIPLMAGVIHTLRTSSMISIAAINGGCAGAGLAIALAADFRYAATTARFNTGFLSAGLSGELGAIWLAVRLVGLGRARQLFMLPDKTSAAALLDAGMLDGVVEPGELGAAVDAVAARLADAPPVALSAMKANFRDALALPLEQYMQAELDGMVRSLRARGEQSPTATGTERVTT